jgi:hypothetical protein
LCTAGVGVCPVSFHSFPLQITLSFETIVGFQGCRGGAVLAVLGFRWKDSLVFNSTASHACDRSRRKHEAVFPSKFELGAKKG